MKFWLAMALLGLLGTQVFAEGPVTVSKDTVLMGSAFSFTAVHQSSDQAWTAIWAGLNEVVRIEKMISSWDPNSETSLINYNAGLKPVKVSPELFGLIERAMKISALSNGYFDISFASIDKIWDFSDAHNHTQANLPSEDAIKASIALINYKNIILDHDNATVFLKEKGMRIGFGAIGKGYAADRARAVMEKLGVTAGVVNAGGDLIAWGTKPDGKPWSIGIADPKHEGEVMAWLDLTDKAVVTSGNYEHYLMINGKRYCHIIDPKTGWPVTGLRSVTIITDHAEIADALATTVFVLGKADGLALIDQLNGVECIIITDEDEILYSDNLDVNLIKDE